MENLTMPTSRRNMIAGLGALTVGGGAVFGSGAFTTTTADRGLEINVITGEQIAQDSVDVLLRQDEYDQVGVDGTASALAPSSKTTYYEEDDTTEVYTAGADEVSLIENNVTTIFGPEGNELLGRSNTTFDPLFELANLVESDGTPTDADVTFDIDDSGNTDFDINGTRIDDNDTTDSSHTITVTADTSESVPLTVSPPESSEPTAGTLTITIEQSGGN